MHGCGLDSLHRRHAVFDHVPELFAVIAVGINRAVAAKRHSDSGFKGLAKIVALQLTDLALLLE